MTHNQTRPRGQAKPALMTRRSGDVVTAAKPRGAPMRASP
jgi:hypothetical protein